VDFNSHGLERQFACRLLTDVVRYFVLYSGCIGVIQCFAIGKDLNFSST